MSQHAIRKMLNHQAIRVGGGKMALLKISAALDQQPGAILAPRGKGQGRGDDGLAADNLDDLVFGGCETALYMRGHLLPKFKHSAGAEVDSLLAIRKHRANGSWFAAREPARGIDAIAAGVEQCASAKLRVGAIVAGRVEWKRKGDVNETQFARFARQQHLPESLHTRVETIHHCLHQ